MERELYRKWNNHPLREILRQAAQGEPIRPDTLDRLQLPKKVRKAAEQAIDRVKPDANGKKAKRMGPGSPDHLSSELVAALPDEWETPRERRQRQAQEGDADALASLKAEEEAEQRMVDRIAQGL